MNAGYQAVLMFSKILMAIQNTYAPFVQCPILPNSSPMSCSLRWWR